MSKRVCRLELPWGLIREVLGLPDDAELVSTRTVIFGRALSFEFATGDKRYTDKREPRSGKINLEYTSRYPGEQPPPEYIKELGSMRQLYLTDIKEG